MLKKYVSMLLVLAMLMSSMPVAAFAEGEAVQEEAAVVETVDLQTEELKAEEPEIEEPEIEEPKAEEPEIEEPKVEWPEDDEEETESTEIEDSDGAGTEDETAQEDEIEEGIVLDPSMMDAALLEETMGSVDAPQWLADAINYPAVSALNVAYKDADSITVYWPEVDHADLIGYRISYSKNDNFDKATREILSSSDSSYLLYDLKIGDTYYFWIQACYDTGVDTVYSSYRKLKGSVTVCPLEPDDLKATINSTTSMTLSWVLPTGYSDLSGYIIERDGVELARVSKTTKSYTDRSVTLGSTYTYCIYSYKNVNGVDVRSECEYAKLDYTAIPPSPVIKTWESVGLNSIKLTWSAVSNADGYNIYRTANQSITPKLVGTVAAGTTTFTDSTNIITGQEYWYFVTAYAGGVESEIVEGAKASAWPPIPKNIKAQYISDSEIKVSWNAVDEDVQGYVVYASDDNTEGSYYEVAEQGEISFIDDSLSIGQKRYYRVKSFVKIQGNRVESDFSSVVSDMPRPLAPENLKVTNPVGMNKQILLEWDASNGAEGYEIRRGTSSSNMELYAVTTDEYYLDENLTCGTKYYYQVYAYATDGDTRYSGKPSATKSLTVKPGRSAFVVATPKVNTNSIAVEWERIEDVTGYYVYATENEGSRTLVATVTPNSAPTRTKTIKNLNPGSSYVFEVAGYYAEGSKKVTGVYQASDPVELPLYSPQDLKRVWTSMKNMRVEWKAVGGADGYEVTITSPDDPSYEYTARTEETTLKVTGLKCGYRYEWSVTGYRIINDQEVHSSESVGVFHTEPDKPTNGKATMSDVIGSSGEYGITLSWSAVNDADGYVIERSDTNGGTYSVIHMLEGANSVSYTDWIDSSDVGMTYYYRIRSYVDAAEDDGAGYGSRYVSGYTAASLTLVPAKVNSVEAAMDGANTVKLTWDELSGVDGYWIYRKIDDGSFKTLRMVNSSDIVYDPDGKIVIWDNDVSVGQRYCYRIRAFVDNGSEMLYGAYSSWGKVTVSPQPPEGHSIKYTNAKSITVRWNKISGVDGYVVYVAKGDGAFSQVARIGSASTTWAKIKGLTCGTDYRFKVAAYKGDAVGEACAPIWGKTAVADVVNLKHKSVSADEIKLSWDVVTDADGYRVEWQREDGTWAFLKNVTTNSYSHSGMTAGAYKTFRVRAYVNSGSNKNGEYTVLSDVYTKTDPPKSVKIAYVGNGSIRLSWSSCEDADGYRVFYKNKEISGNPYSYIDVGVNEGGEQTLKLTGLDTKTAYNLYVRSYCLDDDGNKVTSNMSSTVSATTK